MNEAFVTESPKHLAIGESRAFTIDFTDIGTPSAVNSVTAYDAAGTDVSATLLSGSSSLAGAVATLKLFTPASAQTYRLVCSVTISGNTVYGAIDVIAFSIVPGAVTITNGYCTLAELKARLFPTGLADFDDDSSLVAAIEGVSRAIDEITGRQFYQSAAATRYFTAKETGVLFVDDLVSITTLKTDDDGDRVYETTWSTSDYDLEPYNAAGLNKPYLWIRPSPNGNYSFPLIRKGVQLVGTFGWPAVPKLARDACIIQSIRIFKRGDAPFGVAGSAEMGQLQVLPRLDPDVELLLSKLIRPGLEAI